MVMLTVIKRREQVKVKIAMSVALRVCVCDGAHLNTFISSKGWKVVEANYYI